MILGALAPDHIAPSGTITNPTAASTKSGIIVPTITATDDHGVLGVQWKVDGVNFGSESVVGPFSGGSFDTRLYNDISHSISAVVRDVVNHLTTVSLNFNINNNPGGGSFSTFNPTGGRRSYPSLGSFASPNYVDSPGYSWSGNASPTHYKIQMRYTVGGGAANFESINGPQSDQNHAYALAIGGAFVHQVNNHPVNGTQDSGWFDVSNGVSGSIQFYDWADGGGAGGTAFVGDVSLSYQYVWIG